jgi:hypothetical protein
LVGAGIDGEINIGVTDDTFVGLGDVATLVGVGVELGC